MWGIRLDVNLKRNFVVINKASLRISYILKWDKNEDRNYRLVNTGVSIVRYEMKFMLYPIMLFVCLLLLYYIIFYYLEAMLVKSRRLVLNLHSRT